MPDRLFVDDRVLYSPRMGKWLHNYVYGMGSVLELFPGERDLTVPSNIATNILSAFEQDMKALEGDYRCALNVEEERYGLQTPPKETAR